MLLNYRDSVVTLNTTCMTVLYMLWLWVIEKKKNEANYTNDDVYTYVGKV